MGIKQEHYSQGYLAWKIEGVSASNPHQKGRLEHELWLAGYMHGVKEYLREKGQIL